MKSGILSLEGFHGLEGVEYHLFNFLFSPNYCDLWGISLDQNLKTTEPYILQDLLHLWYFVIIDAALKQFTNLEFRAEMVLHFIWFIIKIIIVSWWQWSFSYRVFYMYEMYIFLLNVLYMVLLS